MAVRHSPPTFPPARIHAQGSLRMVGGDLRITIPAVERRIHGLPPPVASTVAINFLAAEIAQTTHGIYPYKCTIPRSPFGMRAR